MRRLSPVTLFLSLVTLCIPLHAQTVDTAILGTVTDNTGAVIPGATVTVSSPATGMEKKAVTSAIGEYSINYLIPGNYDVTVSANGFSSYKQKSIVLDINQQARINAVMQAGGSTQTVEVTSTQPLLQSQDASLGVVVGTESAANLPLNGRKFNDLAVLTPGVQIEDTDTHSGASGGATINAYGNADAWSLVNVDGIIMSRNREAQINIYPSIDAVQ
jgi:hypothetical protein